MPYAAMDSDDGGDASRAENEDLVNVDLSNRRRVRQMLKNDQWWKETPAQALRRRCEAWLLRAWNSNVFIIVVVDIFVLLFLHIALSAHTCGHIERVVNATMSI